MSAFASEGRVIDTLVPLMRGASIRCLAYTNSSTAPSKPARDEPRVAPSTRSMTRAEPRLRLFFDQEQALLVFPFEGRPVRSAVAELDQLFGCKSLPIGQAVRSLVIENDGIPHPENMKRSRGVSVEVLA